MVRLEKVSGKNLWDVLKLRVKPGQEGFVADNAASLAKAYVAVTGGGHAFPFGIYDGEELVGFLLAAFGLYEHWDSAPAIADGNYSIWRLMVDQGRQHKGYGRKALGLALEFIRAKPCGDAAYCWLSYAPGNAAAKKLYASFGFAETGEMYGDEVVAALKL